ncbi:hypothetical protein FHR83_008663 [Actinoplanes campanulatus]|uniref:YD repeat-containing protein n=1 Tax=Actinoplanes campanulatus TaxID=113559 RepID=A0A7W5AR66_9ACTN|nr:hypothetical protein [Actinoplanes campanulatus]MBB3100936.1 hypothetical protein [Actinoplanes campanulatus]
MTFLSYAVEDGAIVTTVRKPGGGTEKRHYVYDGHGNWLRD